MSIGKRVLITGATGAIGSWHVSELLNRGHEVICLVRGNHSHGRFEKLAAVVGEDVASRVRIISGEIIENLAGVSSKVIEGLMGSVDIVVHHAGSISFDQEYWEDIIRANVVGTRNMLALAEVLGVSKFCYDSTIYTLNIPPRNPYEESKQQAEKAVLNWDKGEAMIWRPSVVVGRASDGQTNGFNGYYGFFSGFNHLKYQLLHRWNESQEQSRNQGFEFDDAGNLVLKHNLFIDYSLTSTLNLVPVDWLVKSMTDLMEQASWGQVYNLADANPEHIAWIFKKTFEIIGIKGVKDNSQRAKSKVDDSQTILSNWQSGLDQRLLRYRCYVMEEKAFSCDAIGSPPPPVDEYFLRTMLDYAVKEKFGHEGSK